jgi:hypothetical protein
MLRKLFFALSNSKQFHSTDEKSFSLKNPPHPDSLIEIMPSLTEDQKTIVIHIQKNTFPIQPIPADIQAYKMFDPQLYQTVYPYLLLAHSFEKNGVVVEHTKKLACVFKNVKEVLYYLQAYSKAYPTNMKFVHDACLFQLPTPSSLHLKEWLQLARNNKNLLNSQFLILLGSSSSIDTQIQSDKAEKTTLLLQTLNKYSETKNDIDIITEEHCIAVQDKLNKMISEKNQFCRHFTSHHNKMSQDEIKSKKNSQYLADLPELYNDRSIIHLRKKIGQYGVDDFNDVYQRVLKLTSPEKKIFIKNGIAEKYFTIFNNLDRRRAGINIPDIGILEMDKGFYFRKLIVSHPDQGALAACLGKLTDCCQSLSGENGEPCTLHGLTHPDSGFYVLFKGNPKQPKITDPVLAQTWVNRTQSGALLFDSIEINEKASSKNRIKDIIIVSFQQLANILIQSHNITRVVCGKTDISESIGFKVHYGNQIEYPKDYYAYRDSQQQLLLADNRLLGILKKDGNLKLNPNAIRTASVESKQILSEAMCFTIGYLLQNKKPSDAFLKYVPTPIKKRTQHYIATQLSFIKLVKSYICNPKKNNTTLQTFIKKKSIDLNFTFEHKTILMWAIIHNNSELLKTLLKLKRIDINFQNQDSDTALLVSTQKKCKAAMLQTLVENKANIDIQDVSQNTALMLSVDNTKKIQSLLQAKANVNIQKKSGRTALITAAGKGQPEGIKALLEAKADANAQNKMGESALMIAAKEGHADLVKALLEKKADLNIQDKFGKTALIAAAENGHIDSVKLLVKAEANQEIEDACEMTALDRAELYNRTDCARFLNTHPWRRNIGFFAGAIVETFFNCEIKKIRKNDPRKP